MSPVLPVDKLQREFLLHMDFVPSVGRRLNDVLNDHSCCDSIDGQMRIDIIVSLWSDVHSILDLFESTSASHLVSHRLVEC